MPAIWLPDPRVREERELARFRLHLVKHRSMLKHRIHSTLINFGRPCPVTDLFGVEGRRLLARLDVPEPWRGNVTASRRADRRPRGARSTRSTRRLRAGHADHPYIPLLMSAPGIGWVLAFTIAAEIGEIERFASPAEAHRLHRAFARGWSSRASPIAAGRSPSTGPRYLRWALLEATMHALKHPAYSERYQRNKRRLGKQRGAKVAQIDIARRLRPRDLAHAFSQREVRSQRRRFSSGGLTALLDLRPRANHPISPDPPDEEAIET